MTNETEEWKDLPTELLLSKYEISNLGRLRNKNTKYIFGPKPYKHGYIRATLHFDDEIKKAQTIHILVANTFIPNPENKPTVNHINCNKTDNRVVNLEWATYSEQNLKKNKNEYKKQGKSINQYDLQGNFIKTWDKAVDVEAELKILISNINSALRGRTKTAGGFIWKYNIQAPIKNEIWKECPLGNDYEKILVSNLGRIKKNNTEPTYGSLYKDGYYRLKFYNNKEKKFKHFQVHRLVAFTFIQNPENKPIVNHIDENPSNNKVENLEWVSNKENIEHSLELNNRTRSNHRSKIVLQIDINTNEIIKEFQSVNQAARENNIFEPNIRACCTNYKNAQSAGGYKWKFKE